jgi:3',5'-cyclic AMP phosphodiesterase CpdA
MKHLIIQLSDIHIKESEDTVLSRGGLITDAVKNLEPGIDRVYILFTGDISYSGTSAQYELAEQFIRSLVTEISSKIADAHPLKCNRIPVYVIVVPGNHDCDFSRGSITARTDVIQGTIQQPESFAWIRNGRSCFLGTRSF